MPKLNLPREFVVVQLSFARRMAALSGESLENAMIDFTHIRTLMSIRVTRDNADKVEAWRSFVDGLLAADDQDEWAYRFYLKSEEGEAELDDTEDFGCFWYTYPFRDTQAVRLHFRNADRSGLGALSHNRSDVRRRELVNMLTEVKTKHPDALTVRGGSWLYNIEPYRRLFPAAYVATAKPVGYELAFWSLWGQFLRGGGGPNLEAIAQFSRDILRASTPQECETCFPYEVLRPECDIHHFYSHFGV